MTGSPGLVRRLWFQWRTMKLPWRKRWLVGYDLQGNTYWEFKDNLNSNRFRRIVEYTRSTHYGDVNVPPQWMQWLRHTRFEPPTIADQHAEIQRQERMKILAAQADARWAAKPSALDAAPETQQPVQMLQSQDAASGIRQMNVGQERRDMEAEAAREEAQQERKRVEEEERERQIKSRKKMKGEAKDSPWKQAPKNNPGEEWQPAPWSPSGPARRK
ncbi:unnamed protein product [Periconia digitata]|uniref:NADH dehydrogenase [ubiquinone] 1 alpha subcomplex subunit n=1 Tax=Periconia digitata TaxID=1303443 RepID=A0A9W4U8C6_9PLEO|nr:unnamed protein product [Periconia digitata]